MKPLLKYPGGKERELQYVIDRLPKKIDNYYEPFLGGGAVYFGLDTSNVNSYLNDKSEDLVLFYNNVMCRHALFFNKLEEYTHDWEYLSEVVDNNYDEFKSAIPSLINFISPNYADLVIDAVLDKIKRMEKLQDERGALPEKDIKDNIECGIKQGYYYYVRKIYNTKIKNNERDEERAAAFYFMRELCYSSMFRFNSSGEFNVPYGGISYNRKDIRAKLERLRSADVAAKFSNTTIECSDFHDFMNKYQPAKDDFVFLDPPYDSEFSNYDNNTFNKNDQERLAEYLKDGCHGKWLMIIKASPLILKLYKPGTKTVSGGKISVEGFDKKYSVSFKNRNLKDCEHLIITNY